MVAVVDVDGVLADVRHRLHFVESRPKDWQGFFAAAPDDPVLDEGLETVRKLAEAYDVVYLSGRPERCRQDTLEWFDRHGVPAGELHLRRSGDFRPARVTKVEVLDRLARDRPVAVLVDDDPLVCEAAREAGYDVLPARWMADDQTLLEAQEVDGRT
jgi:hypothetical protein